MLWVETRLDIMEWWDGVMRVDPPPTLPLLLLWALGSNSDSGGYYLSPITSRQQNSLHVTFGYHILYNLVTALVFREK